MDEKKFYLFLAHLTLMKENYDEVKKYIIESEVKNINNHFDCVENALARKYLNSKKQQKKYIERANKERKERISSTRRNYLALSKLANEVIRGLSKTNGTTLPKVIDNIKESTLHTVKVKPE